jgi:hypothetical protein
MRGEEKYIQDSCGKARRYMWVGSNTINLREIRLDGIEWID